MVEGILDKKEPFLKTILRMRPPEGLKATIQVRFTMVDGSERVYEVLIDPSED